MTRAQVIEKIAEILSPALYYGSTRKHMKGLIGEYQLLEVSAQIFFMLEFLGYIKVKEDNVEKWS